MPVASPALSKYWDTISKKEASPVTLKDDLIGVCRTLLAKLDTNMNVIMLMYCIDKLKILLMDPIV